MMMVEDLPVRPTGGGDWPTMSDDVTYLTRSGHSLTGLAALRGAVEDARPAALKVLVPAGCAWAIRDVLDQAFAQVWWSLDRWRAYQRQGTVISLGAWAARISHDMAADWLRTEAPKRLGSLPRGARPAPFAGDDIADLPDAALIGLAVEEVTGAIVDPPEGSSPRLAALGQLRLLLASRPGGTALWRLIVREAATGERGRVVRQELAAFIQDLIDGQTDPVLGPRLMKLAARAGKDHK